MRDEPLHFVIHCSQFFLKSNMFKLFIEFFKGHGKVKFI